ncbi:hypothetical protein MYK68_20155 [Gordonia sp. PP30]|uniref:hypothetical protein n=1 Tax=unclassified Gordonia (in: high G+C Gram-positive bacteria) TaxID=2657482 RepID=UPI001FFFCDE0|nr:hypothetical protein [Gordonia sp. PP30]UQE74974.1 hypothetical protein MYK68_20155 [Gordonia sp. PP30]
MIGAISVSRHAAVADGADDREGQPEAAGHQKADVGGQPAEQIEPFGVYGEEDHAEDGGQRGGGDRGDRPPAGGSALGRHGVGHCGRG